MISSIDPSIQSFLLALNRIQQNALTAQTQMNTGLRINQVSDAPDQISAMLQTQAQIAHLNQVNTNLGLVQSETNAGETALQSAVQVMDQIQSLAAQGESGTNTADTRSNIATQLGAALTNLVSLANTAAGGRYVFSGDSDQVKPYSIDLTQATPVSTYQGTPATRQVETPDGSQISVAMTAQQIFDGPTPETNVFGAVTALLTAMQNNDQAGIDAAMPQVSSAASYLNRQLASYGSIQNQVSNAIADGQQESVQLATQLNTIQGADLAQAIEQLNQANLQQQAVLGAQSQLSRKSLFDYLG